MTRLNQWNRCPSDSSTHLRNWQSRRIAAVPGVLLVAFLLVVTVPTVARAQGGGLGGGLGGFEPNTSYPSRDYYLALDIYRTGDLENAIRAFDSAMRRTRKDINGQWLDAIPVYAMQAECQWHLGNLEAVRANVDAALELAVRYRGWLGSVDWQGAVRAGATTSPPAGLWPEATAIKRLPTSNRVQFLSGERLTEATIARGGVIEELNVKVMDVIEVMRGIAIASYRRRVLLGPLAQNDPLGLAVVDATKYPADLQLPFGKTLIGSMRSAEHYGAFNDQRTLTETNKTTFFDGGVHPISPVALLAQASASAGTDNPSSVLPIAVSLANVAAALDQPEWIGEAMQLAAGCASKSEAARVRVQAETAATSMLRRSRLATLHCLIAAADAAVTAGDLNSAEGLMGQAISLASRRSMIQPRLNAYGAYVAARLAAAKGQSFALSGASDVDKALNDVQQFALARRFRNRPLISSPRLYQLSRVLGAVGKSLGARTSEQWLAYFGDDPPQEVWRRDPVDALAMLMADRTMVYETRLQLAAARGDQGEVLMLADDVLRHRFMKHLQLHGRVAQVRTLAWQDDQHLAPQHLAFRNQAGQTMGQLRQAALTPVADSAEALLAQAAKLESMASQIALDRGVIPEVIPPPLGQSSSEASLPPRTALLTFIAVNAKLFGILAQEGVVTTWEIKAAARLPAEIGRLLQSIGVGKARGDRLPKDDRWREDALSLRRRMWPDENLVTSAKIDRLIVVPDGALWYLPFELLPGGDEGSPLLGDQIEVRYAATPGLAVRPTSLMATHAKVGIVSDKLFSPRDPEANRMLTVSLAEALDAPVMLPDGNDRPASLLGESISHLLVAVPRAANTAAPLATGLAAYDDKTPQGSLAAWMRFPAAVPRSVLLPGFRTPIDGGRMGTGEELFLLICGLQTAGVRDALISRWAVGGEATQIAMKELVQELPHIGMASSWQRAKVVLRKSELDPLAQPLLTKSDQARENLNGDSPLFWAGYLVVSPLGEDPK